MKVSNTMCQMYYIKLMALMAYGNGPHSYINICKKIRPHSLQVLNEGTSISFDIRKRDSNYKYEGNISLFLTFRRIFISRKLVRRYSFPLQLKWFHYIGRKSSYITKIIMFFRSANAFIFINLFIWRKHLQTVWCVSEKNQLINFRNQ